MGVFACCVVKASTIGLNLFDNNGVDDLPGLLLGFAQVVAEGEVVGRLDGLLDKRLGGLLALIVGGVFAVRQPVSGTGGESDNALSSVLPETLRGSMVNLL